MVLAMNVSLECAGLEEFLNLSGKALVASPISRSPVAGKNILVPNLVQNSWVATNDKYGENPQHGQIPRKTIYDPCPVGFCVPNVTAFSNFVSSIYVMIQPLE